MIFAPFRIRAAAFWIAGVAAALILAGPAHGQRAGQKIKQLEGVGITAKLGENIPLDLTFTNTDGRRVRLGQYFDSDRPVVLYLVYYNCPMICPLMLKGFTGTLKDMSWTPGEEFEVLTISFNPREGPSLAREKKKTYIGMLGKPEAASGWHFLTGSKPSIARLTDAVGFNYKWIEDKQEYAHQSAVIFLSGQGKISRYLYGMEPAAGDARKALVEASSGKVGNVIDQIALTCFQYDPNENSYVADAFNIMRLGGVLTMIILGAVLFVFWRREGKEISGSEDTVRQDRKGRDMSRPYVG